MKKFIFSLFIILSFIFSAVAYGAEGTIIDNRAYVPVRGVFEELGFSVTYDSKSATAVISNDSYKIEIPKNQTYFMVNDKSIKPDSPQKVVDGTMYLPLRAIGDSIGGTVSWNSEKKLAHISYNGKDSYATCKAPEPKLIYEGNGHKIYDYTSKNTSNAFDSNKITVYRGKTGNKYHKENCGTLKTAIPMTLAEAKKQGREPCKVCKPKY